MTGDWFIILLTFFVGLVAISQVVQMIALVVLQRRAKELQQQVAEFSPRAESILVSAKETLDQTRTQVADLSAKANDVLDTTRSQLGRVEGLLTEVTSRAKAQMDRAELVLDDTLGRVHETVAVLHNGVMKPVREVSGLAAGFKAALAHLMKGGRPNVSQATHDEEMFI
jgi:ABC-type transporter Mla subunit MlaD